MLQSVRLRLIASFLAAWVVFVGTISIIVWLAACDIARNSVVADVNLASLRVTRLAFQYALDGRLGTADVQALANAQTVGLHVNVAVVPRLGFLGGPYVFDAPATVPPIGVPNPALRQAPGIGPRLEMQSVPFGTMSIDIFPDIGYLNATSLHWLVGAIIVDLLTLIPAWYLASLVAERTLEPLLSTTRALERFAAGDFTPQEVTTRQRTEIGDLARAYNAAVQQITQAFQERSDAMDEMRQFVADAGHQLRTPLTVLMGHISAMRPTTPRETTIFGNMLAQSRRMKAIIDDLIVLARLEHGEPECSCVDLNQLAESVVATFRTGGYERVELQPYLGEALARVNTGELVDSLTALVENALKYAPIGPVRVIVAHQDGRCTISVEDCGPGMSQSDLEHAFDRFYRGDASAGIEGTGLGLSIVHRGVERSNGTVTLVNTGGGLRATLSFAA